MLNFNKIIKTYNISNGKQLDENERWGLSYLSVDNLHLLNQSFDIIERAASIQPPYRIEKNIHSMLQEARAHSSTHAIHHMYQASQEYHKQTVYLTAYEWEKQTKALLDKEEIWNQWIEKAQHTKEQLWLIKKRQEWHQHSEFYLHSSAALLAIMQNVFELQQHFEQARHELAANQRTWLFWRRMPKEIAKDYEAFLKDRISFLSFLKANVIEAILLRLKVAAKSAPYQDHFTSYLMKQLQEKKYVKKQNPIHKPEGLLSAEQFNMLYYAVEKEGSKEQRARFYKLAFNQDNQETDKEIKVVKTKEGLLLSPLALIKYVPAQLRHPRWLFADSHARRAFFTENRQLFTMLRQIEDKSAYQVERLSTHHPFYIELVTRFQRLNESLQACQHKQIPWWHLSCRALYQTWIKTVKEEIEKLTDIIENWLVQIKDEIEKDHFLQTDPLFCKKMQSMIIHLQAVIGQQLKEDKATLFREKCEAIIKQVTLSTPQVSNKMSAERAKSVEVASVKHAVSVKNKSCDASLIQPPGLIPLMSNRGRVFR